MTTREMILESWDSIEPRAREIADNFQSEEPLLAIPFGDSAGLPVKAIFDFTEDRFVRLEYMVATSGVEEISEHAAYCDEMEMRTIGL